MHDQVLMRELHGCTDLTKELQPFDRIEFLLVAIARDGRALDILQHEIRQAIVRSATINQPRNVRVIEVGKDLPLHHKALDDCVGVHAALDEL